MIITIDGPAGSGKTSVARLVAEKLDMYVLQTGLLYRAAAYVILERRELAFPDVLTLDQLCLVRDSVTLKECVALDSIEYGYQGGSKVPFVCIRGERVEEMLSDAWLSLPASLISQSLLVRDWANNIQREIAKKYAVVAEGRDCGTVVFPHADFKFFLTASVEVRAQRMLGDVSRKAQKLTPKEAQASIAARDAHDQTRVMAPLVAACGAMVIDTSAMTLEQVVSCIILTVAAKSMRKTHGAQCCE